MFEFLKYFGFWGVLFVYKSNVGRNNKLKSKVVIMILVSIKFSVLFIVKLESVNNRML